MQSKIIEYRQAALMAAIVAIVPLLFFPNTLGLKLNVSALLFFSFELIFYWSVFAFYLKGSSPRNIFMAGTFCFFSRLCAGIAFAILAWVIHSISFKTAMTAGLFQYKPAMLLQVISFPFILANIMKIHFHRPEKDKVQFVIQPLEEAVSDTKSEVKNKEDYSDRKIIGLKNTSVDEKPFLGFDDALKYVGELSSVRFAALIDQRGLPVSSYGKSKRVCNLWSAIGVYLVEKIKEPLKRAGEFDLEGFELTLDVYRIHVVRIDSLYLLVAANLDSGETEKVRINQVATMIRKIYQERYNTKSEKVAREDSYVPSFS